MHSLNHIYRTIWSEVLGTWIAVSEITRAKGKRSGSCLLRALNIGGVSEETADIHAHRLKPLVFALACCFAFNAQANPSGGNVVHGSAGFNTTGSTLTVTNTPGTIINWQNFSIGKNETTRFVQQSASSTVLNRVVTNNPSAILGTLSSNGQVYLVNANGIVFGAGSTVNVAGMVASTLDISNADFLAGRNKFSATAGAQDLSNAGNINAQQGGRIYLIAPNVENTGIITAPGGEVLLAAGHSVEIVNSNDPALRVRITSGGTTTNLGQLIAESGTLGLFGAVVKNSGIVSADSAVMQGGKIVFKATNRVEAGGSISASGTGGGEILALADMQNGTVDVSGTLDASAPVSGDGGFIETSAANVHVADSARITTSSASGNAGMWLLDPYDFTIASVGGDITGAALSTALGAGNVTIQTLTGSVACTGVACGTGNPAGNGDIFVNDTVTWTANTLTLSAYRNININANMTGTIGAGTPQLVLEYGQGALAAGNTADYFIASGVQVNLPAGVNFHTRLGSDGLLVDYTVITTLGAAGSMTGTDLQGMQGNLAGNYVLGANIDATGITSTWNYNAVTLTYDGFAPVGTSNAASYTGRFDGLGHTVTGLYINRPTTNYVGLFGYAFTGAELRNLGLVNANITGQNFVGALLGWGYYTNGISDDYVTGSTVTGVGDVGGLVGTNYFSSNISGSNVSSTSVTGSGSNVGGVVGNNTYGNITKSHATNVTVAGAGAVGGLAGYSAFGTLTDSYVDSGSVTGTAMLGGLVGADSGTVANSHYDINNVTINGASRVTLGGIYTAQFTDWLTNNLTLNIANYSVNLAPLGGNNYGVSNAAGLRDMLGFADNSAYAFTQTANIDLTADAGLYIPYLAGNFNGAGFTISNLNLNPGFANNNLGLFGQTAVGSTVSGVTLTNATVNGGSNVGAVAGLNRGTINLSHVNGTSSVSGSGNNAGGLVGNSLGNISNSDVTGAGVNGNLSAGGLVGYSLGNISNSFVSGGTVTGTSTVGGLAGRFDGIVTGSHVSASSVSGAGSNIGGLVGNAFNATISNSYVDDGGVVGSTVVSGNINVGGLLGADGGEGNTVITGNNVTNVTVTGVTSVGGLVGMKGGGWGSTGYIDNSHVLTSSVAGTTNVGGLVGNNDTAVSNSSVTGATVTGSTAVGGLVGLNNFVGTGSGTPYGGRINNNSYVSGGTVSGNSQVGGLAGNNLGDIASSFVTGVGVTGGTTSSAANAGGLVGQNSGSIANTYVSGGTVSGWMNVGGLAGQNGGAISNSYVTAGSVLTGSSNGGGLVGNNTAFATIDTSFALNTSIGQTTSGSALNLGGLVGSNAGAITNSYVSGGTVVGGTSVGGLVGYNTSSITNSYASTGVLTAAVGTAGGLAGYNAGTITDSFWDTTVSGAVVASGSALGTEINATGLTTAQMHSMSSFTNWSIANTGGAGMTWRIYEGQTGPMLTYLLTQTTVTANNATVTYSGTAYSGGNGVTANAGPATAGGSLVAGPYGGTAQGAVNAGSYTLTAAGAYSDQLGYDITGYTNGTLTIGQATLTLNAVSDTKVYDGTTVSTGTVNAVGLVGGDTITGATQSFGSRNVLGANGSTLTANNTGYTISDGNGGNNYTVVIGSTATGTITPASLTVTADNLSKFEGMADPALTYTVGGLQTGDTAATTLSGSLVRDPGEVVGAYGINQGTLALTSANYTLVSYTPGIFTIVEPPPITPPLLAALVDGTLIGGSDLPGNDDDDKPGIQSSADDGSGGDQGGNNLGNVPVTVCQ